MNQTVKISLILALFLCIILPVKLQSQNALNFDGGNDVVQTTYPGVLGSANRTFEAWINVSPSATANTAILDYGLNAVGSRNTFLINPNDQVAFISGGTNANISSSSNAITRGQWTHVAFVLDNGTGYFFVDGTMVGFGNLSTVNTPSGADVTIGQRVSGGSIPFLGAIDEVRIWDVARTPAEIQANMSTEFCTIPPSLKAYYKFNHGIAGGTNTGLTTLNDNSGNGNNGTLQGFSLSGTTSNWVSGASLSASSLTGGMDTVVNCIPFLTPGNQTLNMTGMYQDTVVLTSGCDSIYTLDFTALSPSSATINPSVCNTYLSPLGNVLTSSGTYSDTLTNAIGCDSILTINLTILTNSLITLNDTACDSYLSPNGITWDSSGTYQDTLLNAAGCDSILTINLVVNSRVDTSISDTSCGPYTSNMGNTYSTSGTYIETAFTINGCDSIITFTLDITTTDTSVSQNGTMLSATQTGAAYQWFECNTQSAITGETAQTFTPTVSGSYFVVIQNGVCADTSNCHTVMVVGIEEPELSSINLYPNPTSGMVTLDLERETDPVSVRVLNAEGKIIHSIDRIVASRIQLELGQAAGLYTVLVSTGEGYRAYRVVKVD